MDNHKRPQCSIDGFSMGGTRKTRHRIKPKHAAKWVKMGGRLQLPPDADGIEVISVGQQKVRVRPITFDNVADQVDNTAVLPTSIQANSAAGSTSQGDAM